MDILRKIRNLRHYDKIVKHKLLAHKGIDFCFINSANCVADNPGISQDKLANLMYVNKSTMTRNLCYFEENGYVTRQTSASDKRITLVYPTQKLHDMLEVINERLCVWKEELFDGFSEEEIAQYNAMTDKMMENAAKYIEKIKEEQNK